ncbi:hypothetical protein TNCV_2363821 [Trichonephila clavipes]|nr:hypothetical protein TNCV_2363821 [Trichonephila clavipes]
MPIPLGYRGHEIVRKLEDWSTDPAVAGWCSTSVYAHQQKLKLNKRNNFGCLFSEAEQSVTNFFNVEIRCGCRQSMSFCLRQPFTFRLGQKLDEKVAWKIGHLENPWCVRYSEINATEGPPLRGPGVEVRKVNSGFVLDT